MKTAIRKNATAQLFLTVIIIIGLSLFSLVKVYGQDKPKGKPWSVPDEAVKMKNPVKADESNLKEGKDLYSQHCKSCHGVKGKGDGTKAAQLEIQCGDFSSDEFSKESDGSIFWKTTEGRKPMPSFNEKLSDQERWLVINYIRTLKEK